MISLRREINQSEASAAKTAELAKGFKTLALAISKLALPANPNLSKTSSKTLMEAMALLDRGPAEGIDQASDIALNEIEQIFSSNEAALQERDGAIKSIVTLVANTVGSFNGDCEAQSASLTKLADHFDALSSIKDPNELRRQLQAGVGSLRGSAEKMRRDNQALISRFDTQMATFQRRLEAARKDSTLDRLTGFGSRLEASRHLKTVAARRQPVCFQLFDIEGFRAINQTHGTLLGDQLLKALAHMLQTTFSGQEGLFRWAADEFLVIAEGELAWRTSQCAEVRRSFSAGRYITVHDSQKLVLNADVAFGVVQFIPGEDIENTYVRARQMLEQSRKRRP